ncbi:hypothetical protein PRIPAC_71742 [Pristionchus pacificus]|uniref:Glycosyltransferase n=1 Tax=Pristionchus pacificus TaxID=54126 RepID=A0A8R1YUE6_PRIPA|nr:hypothetical protein PRIPAC_71742 [Pristionchus pacificus]|eukprot:PDM76850.1 hypothetical protein PRIPAC_42245 [Pristionchus pacificus]
MAEDGISLDDIEEEVDLEGPLDEDDLIITSDEIYELVHSNMEFFDNPSEPVFSDFGKFEQFSAIFSRNFLPVVITFSVVVMVLVFTHFHDEGFYSNGRRRLYKDWTKCMNEQLTDYSVEKWNTFPQAVDLCMNTLAVISPSKFRNTDETKYAYLTNSESEIVLVTIGVGLDTNSEDKFRKEQPKTKFFGADPISERNEELYTKIGDFFPFAVGKETKKTMASGVTTSSSKQTEGAEFGIYDMFYRNGDFEKENIVICQINMETHFSKPEDKIPFLRFIEKIVNDGKYIIVRTLTINHNRLFFVNIESKYCLDKFKINIVILFLLSDFVFIYCVLSYLKITNQSQEAFAPITRVSNWHRETDNSSIIVLAHNRFIQNVFCMSLPSNTDKEFARGVHSLADCFDNIHVMPISKVTWGSFEILRSTHEGMKYLVENKQWRYLQFLSGVDVPLRTNLEMVRILKQWNGISYTQLEPFQKNRFVHLTSIRSCNHQKIVHKFRATREVSLYVIEFRTVMCVKKVNERREHPDAQFDATQYNYLPQIEFSRSNLTNFTRLDLFSST